MEPQGAVKRRALRQSILYNNNQDLETIEGYLKKKSKNGTWQKRYFDFNAQYLRYYKTNKRTQLKGWFDVRDTVEVPSLVDRFGEFTLVMEDRELSLKADNIESAQKWLHVIEKRSQFYQEVKEKNEDAIAAVTDSSTGDLGSKLSLKSDSAAPSNRKLPISKNISSGSVGSNDNHISQFNKAGWLSKRSPSRFVAWQERFFRLIDGTLYYYKYDKVNITNYLGEIMIDTSCLITAFSDEVTTAEGVDGTNLQQSTSRIKMLKNFKAKSNSDNGSVSNNSLNPIHKRIFFIKTRFRTYELQANSVEESNEWQATLKAIQKFLAKRAAAVEKHILLEEQRKLEQEKLPPAWIIEWEQMTDVKRVESIQNTLSNVFEESVKQGDMIAIINASTVIIEELDDMAKECLPLGDTNYTEAGREPRVNVFLFHLRFYHMRIVQEISMFLSDDYVHHASTQDLLRLMDLIVAYNDKLEEILNSVSKEVGTQLRENIPPFAMMDNVNHMTDIYIKKLKNTLDMWLDNIVESNVNYLEDRVQEKADNCVMTCAPIDIFNMLNETLVMAFGSGVERLQAAVLSLCLLVINDYLFSMMSEILEDKEKFSIRFLSAVINDCWTFIEKLDSLEEEHAELVTKYGLRFEPVRDTYNENTIVLVKLLADIIVEDMGELTQGFFTDQHLRQKASPDDIMLIERVVATLDDYFNDFKVLLDPPYFIKLTKYAIFHLNIIYCKAALCHKHLFNVFGQGEHMITGADIAIMKEDQQQLIRCISNFCVRPKDTARLYKYEFQVLVDIIDLLSVNPDFFPTTVSNILKREPATISQHIVQASKTCLHLRYDLKHNKELSGEIEDALKNVFAKSKSQHSASNINEHITGNEFQGYDKLFETAAPDYQTKHRKNNSKSTEFFSKIAHTLNAATSAATSIGSSSSTPSSPTKQSAMKKFTNMLPVPVLETAPLPAATPSKKLSSRRVSIVDPSKQSTSKADTLPKMETDISSDATANRIKKRHEKNNQVVEDVELHGYLEKRNPSKIWQRRWFILRRLLEPSSGKWLLALAWHKDHKSPEKGHVFINDVLAVERGMHDRPDLEDSEDITPDNTTVIFKKNASGVKRSAGGIKSKNPFQRSSKSSKNLVHDHCFRVVTKPRIYYLRARSTQEMLSWVKGLTQAVEITSIQQSKSAPHLNIMSEEEVESDVTDTESEEEASLPVIQEEKLPPLLTIHPRNMKVSQLKQQCKALRVDCSNIIEKSELIHLVLDHSKDIQYEPYNNPEQEDKIDFDIKEIYDDKTHALNTHDVKEASESKKMTEMADNAFIEEGKKLLQSRSISQLRKTCISNNLDISHCIEKSHLVEVLLKNPSVLKSMKKRKDTQNSQDENSEALQQDNQVALEFEAQIRAMIANGMTLQDSGQVKEAIAIFNKAVRESQECENRLLEAHSLAALASAYTNVEERAAASPGLFEMAADLFESSGEKSCQITMLAEAAEAYRCIGLLPEALRNLEKHDKISNTKTFEKKIIELKQEIGITPSPNSSPTRNKERSRNSSSGWNDWLFH